MLSSNSAMQGNKKVDKHNVLGVNYVLGTMCDQG